MRKIICSKKGVKLSQEKDCKCEEFNLFINKTNEIVAKCTKCNTIYTLDNLKKSNK